MKSVLVGPGGALRGGGLAQTLVLGGAVLVALYLVAAPLGMLLLGAFRGPADFLPFEPGARWTLGPLVEVLTDPVLYRTTLADTLVFTAGAVALGFSTAFVLAWLVERTDLPLRGLWFTLITARLVMPGVVLAMAWIFLLGPNAGWLNAALRALFGGDGAGPLDIFSMPGLIFAQGLSSVPFIFLLLTAALRTMDPALEEASSVSGASPRMTFLRVTLPVLAPGLLAPLILVTILTLEQFEMPLVLGLPAKIHVFSTRIYWELTPLSGLPNFARAAAAALPILAVALVLLAFYNRLIRRADRFVTITGRGYRPRRLALGPWRWPALAFVSLYAALATLLPAFVLLWTSLFGYGTPSLAQLPQFSLGAYRALLSDPNLGSALGNTAIVAIGSATLVTVVSALIAWILVRTRIPGRGVIDVLSFVSIGIPSVIAGLGVMLFYLSVPLPIYGTVWILVLAYAYRLSVATRVARAGLMQIHRELEEASATSGVGWAGTFRRVVAPLMSPSLVGVWVLLFIVGVQEFTLPLVLFSPENVVMSVLLWRLFAAGETAKAAALAVLIMAIVLPVVFLARTVLLRRARHL